MSNHQKSAMQHDDVRVSLIVPVCNVAPYVRNCLDSLIGQTLNEIEILCYDDASTDESGQILEEYAQKDARVKVVHYPENKTAAQARKDGTLQAKGQYIIYVDGDDGLFPNACENLVAAMDANQVDMIQFDTEVVVDEELPEGRIDALKKLLTPYHGRLNGDILKYCFAENKFHFQIWNKIYKAEICKQAMRHFPDGRFSKAQDLFAFFLISYFSHSYLGLPQEKYYRYGFGRGVTGHTHLSRATIKRYAEQALVAQGIRKFLSDMNSIDDYQVCLQNVESRLFFDSYAQLQQHILKEDMPYAFDLYCQYWGVETLLRGFVTEDLYESKHWAEQLLPSNLLHLPPRKVKKIATFYHSIANGGAQRVVVNLIHLWKKLGYDIVLYTDVPPSPDDYPLPAGVNRVVISPFALNDPEKRSVRMKEFYQSLKEQQVDLVVYHAWVAPSVLWDLLCAKLAGALFYVHCHSVFSMPLLSSSIVNRFFDLQSVYQLADGIITLSETDSHYWRNFNTRVFTVVNPLTEDLKTATTAPLQGKTLLWVGRISAEKNPLHAIEIFYHVHQVHPDAKLQIVGKGVENLENEMRYLITSLKLNDSVELCGFHQDVSSFYRHADLLLSTSQYEGFSLSLQEAQSYGLPCVLYNMPNLTLLEGGKGVFPVNMGDINAAAQEIIRLFNQPALLRQAGIEAKSNVIEKCAIDFELLWQNIIESTNNEQTKLLVDSYERRMLQTLTDHVQTYILSHQKDDASQIPEKLSKTIIGKLLHKFFTLYNRLESGGLSEFKRILQEKKELKAH
ncbi:MAG: glycosyltransferase [Clostridia bacterium]|nr:glycosyltransferase [Clostridia bacterium]